ncbi:hypothetical protein, partial [Prosthecochloris ethylica]|uniref:hypothetical protein n=1 Tax=Prosthecochloris ethylica TaxID=2743976 RepID=UPI001A906D29
MPTEFVTTPPAKTAKPIRKNPRQSADNQKPISENPCNLWAKPRPHGSAPLAPTENMAHIRESLFVNGERCRGERRSPATNLANHRMPTEFVTTPPAKTAKQQFAK